MGVAPAVIVSGLMFGSAHLLGNPMLYKSLVQFALIGMVFALVYWRSGNLLSTIGAHFTFNLMGVALIAATTCDETGAIAALRHWGSRRERAGGDVRAGAGGGADCVSPIRDGGVSDAR